jgi:hypothetical protein
MAGFKLGEKLSDWPKLSLSCVLQALTDTLFGVSLRGNIEKALVGFRILHNSRRPSVDREHQWTLALPELLHKDARTSAEGGQRLDVRCDVEQARLQKKAPYKVL